MAKAVRLLGVPQDNNSSYLAGARLAPDRIREATRCDSANLFTETGIDLGDSRLWDDAGDVALANLGGAAVVEAIRSHVAGLIAEGGHLLWLGGDHSISYPAILAPANVHDGLNVLHIDAHPDLYDSLLENRYSPASPFARLMESGKINRLVQVGIRTLTRHQRDQAQRFGVEIHEMRERDHRAASDRRRGVMTAPGRQRLG
jgi:arginase